MIQAWFGYQISADGLRFEFGHRDRGMREGTRTPVGLFSAWLLPARLLTTWLLPARLLTTWLLPACLLAALTSDAHAARPEDYPPLGFKPLPPSVAQSLMAPTSILPSVPSSLDWRDAGIITAAKNQLQCGGCWSFAASGCLEAMAVLRGAAGSIDLSEQFSLSCDTLEFMAVTNDGCCGGSVTAFEFLKNNHALTEACFPYGEGDKWGPRECTPGGGVGSWNLVDCPDPFPPNSGWNVVAWTLLPADVSGIVSVANLKAALLDGPVWLGYYVYNDFYTFWQSAGSNEVYTHTGGGSALGGHAILLIGYDDSKSAWIIKNSWGLTGPSGDGTCLISYTANCDFGINGATITVMPGPLQEAACCAADGSCYVTTEGACSAIGGAWYSGSSSCSPNPCPDVGACCFADGDCEIMTEGDCATAGGTWHVEWTDCDPNPCPQPEAACCSDEGSCQILTQAACTAASGTWHSEWTTCEPNPCPQLAACCSNTGTCQLMLAGACATAGGTWLEAFESCDPNPCELHVCCIAGACSLIREDECIDQAGQWHAGYDDCATVNCADSVKVCCVETECFLAWEADCQSLGGVFHPSLATCDPNPCPVPASKPSWGSIKSRFRKPKQTK